MDPKIDPSNKLKWYRSFWAWFLYHINPATYFPVYIIFLCAVFALIFITTYKIIIWLSFFYSMDLKALFPALSIIIPLVGGIITYIWQRHTTSNRKRYDAMAELEEILSHVYDGVKLIRNKLKLFCNRGLALFTNFPSLDIPKDTVHSLSRIDVKNDAFSLILDLQRLMQDADLLREGVEKLNDRYGNNVAALEADSDHQGMLAQYPDIIDFCDQLLVRLESCLLKVRFFIKNDRPLPMHLPFYSKNKLAKWFVTDRKTLREEIRGGDVKHVSRDKYCRGNACEDAVGFKMWLVGDIQRWCWEKGEDFNVEKVGPRNDSEVEIKWSYHDPNDPRTAKRDNWSSGGYYKAISLLVHGSFKVIFFDKETKSEKCIHLQKEGDYVMWYSDVPHKWEAVEKSLIATVRW